MASHYCIKVQRANDNERERCVQQKRFSLLFWVSRSFEVLARNYQLPLTIMSASKHANKISAAFFLEGGTTMATVTQSLCIVDVPDIWTFVFNSRTNSHCGGSPDCLSVAGGGRAPHRRLWRWNISDRLARIGSAYSITLEFTLTASWFWERWGQPGAQTIIMTTSLWMCSQNGTGPSYSGTNRSIDGGGSKNPGER